MAKYIKYLHEQLRYWKGKAKESTSKWVGHAEYMVEGFKEKIIKYKEEGRDDWLYRINEEYSVA